MTANISNVFILTISYVPSKSIFKSWWLSLCGLQTYWKNITLVTNKKNPYSQAQKKNVSLYFTIQNIILWLRYAWNIKKLVNITAIGNIMNVMLAIIPEWTFCSTFMFFLSIQVCLMYKFSKHSDLKTIRNYFIK